MPRGVKGSGKGKSASNKKSHSILEDLKVKVYLAETTEHLVQHAKDILRAALSGVGLGSSAPAEVKSKRGPKPGAKRGRKPKAEVAVAPKAKRKPGPKPKSTRKAKSSKKGEESKSEA